MPQRNGLLFEQNDELLREEEVSNQKNTPRLSVSPSQEGMNIYIIFWPQILEYIGFGGLIGIGIWILSL